MKKLSKDEMKQVIGGYVPPPISWEMQCGITIYAGCMQSGGLTSAQCQDMTKEVCAVITHL
jgi:bacteriocin-like protein